MATFLSGEQSCKRNMISLVAMGTEMDEDVSWFTGCLVCVCACACVCLFMCVRLCEPAHVLLCIALSVHIGYCVCMCMHPHKTVLLHLWVSSKSCSHLISLKDIMLNCSVKGQCSSKRGSFLIHYYKKYQAASIMEIIYALVKCSVRSMIYFALWCWSGAHFTVY